MFSKYKKGEDGKSGNPKLQSVDGGKSSGGGEETLPVAPKQTATARKAPTKVAAQGAPMD